MISNFWNSGIEKATKLSTAWDVRRRAWAFGTGLLSEKHKSQVGSSCLPECSLHKGLSSEGMLCDRIGEISHDFLKILESSNWLDVLMIFCWESFGKGIQPERMKSLRPTLPETNSQFVPKNGWLEYDPFLLGFGLFSGAFTVTFREGRRLQLSPTHPAGFLGQPYPFKVWGVTHIQYLDVLLEVLGSKARISELYTPNIFRLYK